MLPSFPRASTISSSSKVVVEGVFRESDVVHSIKMVDPVLFVFGSHVFHQRLKKNFSWSWLGMIDIFGARYIVGDVRLRNVLGSTLSVLAVHFTQVSNAAN